MRSAIIFSLMLTLSGCSTIQYYWDSYNTRSFDPVEYSIVVDIKTSSMVAQADCEDVSRMRDRVEDIYKSALDYKNYAEALDNNQSSAKMAQELEKIVSGLRDRYRSAEPSLAYCQNKLKLIGTTADTIQRSLARKKQ